MQIYDLVVVGGGSAGFAAAIDAAEQGAKVALVEAGLIGGTCVNVGCVPSKTLLAAAQTRHTALSSRFEGIRAKADPVDFSKVIGQKDALVEELRKAKYLDVLEAYPAITLLRGHARIDSAERVQVDGRPVGSSRVVIATGARPWAPPIEGLEAAGYWTSTEALSASELPRHLLVIGGSAVGLELAQMYARLGSRVTVLEALGRIAPAEDESVGPELAGYLLEEGVESHAGVQVLRVRRGAEGYEVDVEEAGRTRTVHGDRLLVATGRRPHTDGMGLEKLGIKLTRTGAIEVDEFLETAAAGVYAAGDVTGKSMFVYVAAYQGTLAARNALGKEPAAEDLTAVPRVTFTDPAVASVGLTAEQAWAAGHTVMERSLPLAYVPRALANRDTRGFVKIVAEEGTERILGVHILAPDAGEMIIEATLAVRFELTLQDIRDTLHPYLTFGEGLKLAAMSFTRDVTKLSCCAG